MYFNFFFFQEQASRQKNIPQQPIYHPDELHMERFAPNDDVLAKCGRYIILFKDKNTQQLVGYFF
jgi:hypothetical protein